MIRTLSLIIIGVCGLSGCTHTSKQAATMPWIRLAPGEAEFESAPSPACSQNAVSFRPWGFNYDRDYKFRLIEDYWDTEWQTIVEDFREMKDLGANVVRVHLQFSRFMLGPKQPNRHALDQLRRLLQLAQETRLYLDITGLGCYRKADVPAWYDALDESGRWEAQAAFWEAIAAECKDSPAVFCYDLMNEPLVPVAARKPGDWLVGELAGFWYVQAVTLDPAGRNRPEIASQWVRRLTKAIRNQDQRHLVTVGMLPNGLETPLSESGFVPSQLAPHLDFICVHMYPNSKTFENDLKTVKSFAVGKPVVVEEIFPLGCTIKEIDEFMRRSSRVSGWIGFYWGQTPTELGREKTIPAAMLAEWLTFFSSRARNDTGIPAGEH